MVKKGALIGLGVGIVVVACVAGGILLFGKKKPDDVVPDVKPDDDVVPDVKPAIDVAGRGLGGGLDAGLSILVRYKFQAVPNGYVMDATGNRMAGAVVGMWANSEERSPNLQFFLTADGKIATTTGGMVVQASTSTNELTLQKAVVDQIDPSFQLQQWVLSESGVLAQSDGSRVVDVSDNRVFTVPTVSVGSSVATWNVTESS